MILGIIYKNGEIINHRSLLKVVLNPILRFFGYEIGTPVYTDGCLGLPCICKCSKKRIKWEKYGDDYDKIVKKRRII